jgi:hypothetical protein
VRISYAPTSRSPAVYRPLSLVVSVRLVRVSDLMIVTFAPRITAPPSSFTTPEIIAPVCAKTIGVSDNAASTINSDTTSGNHRDRTREPGLVHNLRIVTNHLPYERNSGCPVSLPKSVTRYLVLPIYSSVRSRNTRRTSLAHSTSMGPRACL